MGTGIGIWKLLRPMSRGGGLSHDTHHSFRTTEKENVTTMTE